MEITSIIKRFEGARFPTPPIKLRKDNQIKTIQGTVAIEGNTLSLEQITAILEGKRVVAPIREIVEVQNAIEAYNAVARFDVFSEKSFLKAHKILMKDLIPDAGTYRNKSVGIMQEGKVSHLAPPAWLVGQHMADLFRFLKHDTGNHPLVNASVFHYELEFIHPFSDGNGRIGRLWEHALLIHWNPLMECLSIEAIIKKYQREYYRALSQADQKGSSEDFIEFNLQVILESLQQFADRFVDTPAAPRDRLDLAAKKFASKKFSRKDYLDLFQSISTSTASRDLKMAVDSGLLKATGSKNATRYVFL